MVENLTVLQESVVTPVNVSSPTQNDASFLAVEGASGVARVSQGLGSHLEGQKMVRFSPIDGVGHDAELQRVELCQRAKEAAHGAVDAVVGGRVWIDKTLGPFVGGGSHRIDPI
nr:hypothetical protein [Synechococcus sp. Tobar12-5m-g]